MRGIQIAFHHLGPVAVHQLFRDIAVWIIQNTEFQFGQFRQHIGLGAHVSPDDSAPFPGRVGLGPDGIVVPRAGGDIGQVHRLALHIELPAMVDAAQAAFLVPAKEQIGAAMGAMGLQQAQAALGVAEGDQLLAHHRYAQGRAVRLRQLLGQRHGLPETAEILPHGRIGAGSGEKVIFLN